MASSKVDVGDQIKKAVVSVGIGSDSDGGGQSVDRCDYSRCVDGSASEGIRSGDAEVNVAGVDSADAGGADLKAGRGAIRGGMVSDRIEKELKCRSSGVYRVDFK